MLHRYFARQVFGVFTRSVTCYKGRLFSSSVADSKVLPLGCTRILKGRAFPSILVTSGNAWSSTGGLYRSVRVPLSRIPDRLPPYDGMSLPVSASMFSDFTECSSHIFIDKSPFISEVINDNTQNIVILRPSRFGKSINLSMLYDFLSMHCKGRSLTWFQDLKIAQDTKAMNYRGNIPVILLDLRSAGGSSYGQSLYGFARIILDKYHFFGELLSKNQNSTISESYHRVCKKLVDITNPMLTGNIERSESFLVYSFFNLTRLLFMTTGEKPYLLIDEYDSPVLQAYRTASGSFHGRILKFMRVFFSSILSGNAYLAKTVIIGIDLVDVFDKIGGEYTTNIHSVLEDDVYAEYFGFTEGEVSVLLSGIALQHVKRHYGGYMIGRRCMHNPFSVIRYMDDGQSHWGGANFGSRLEIVKQLSILRNFEMLQDLALLSTSCRKCYSLARSVDLLHTYSNNNLAEHIRGLMLSSGYLTSTGTELSFKRITTCYKLKAPNMELAHLLETIISRWLHISAAELVRYLGRFDIKGFCEAFEAQMREVASALDNPDFSKIYSVIISLILPHIKSQYIVKYCDAPHIREFAPLLLIPNEKFATHMGERKCGILIKAYRSSALRDKLSYWKDRISSIFISAKHQRLGSMFVEYDIQDVIYLDILLAIHDIEFHIKKPELGRVA